MRHLLEQHSQTYLPISRLPPHWIVISWDLVSAISIWHSVARALYVVYSIVVSMIHGPKWRVAACRKSRDGAFARTDIPGGLGHN